MDSSARDIVDLDWLMAGDSDRAQHACTSPHRRPSSNDSPRCWAVCLPTSKTPSTPGTSPVADLDKPLLIVIDEAAQLQLGWLPTEVSTIAALGAFFVTCWQNLAQINHRYGTLADAVLSGHRTKCFFAGIDDLATGRYLTGLLGHQDTIRRSHNRELPTGWVSTSGGRRSVSESTQRDELAPAHAIRQMIPGQAVLIHGTLPPIHLDAIRWWNEPVLKDLIPTDLNGQPTVPGRAHVPGDRCRVVERRRVGHRRHHTRDHTQPASTGRPSTGPAARISRRSASGGGVRASTEFCERPRRRAVGARSL